MSSIQDALLDATRALSRSIEDHEARLQAELLLAHALETLRAMMLARLDETIAPDVVARYDAMIARRANNEPLAYILGRQEFYGIDFIVDRRVLIPRHETESLVQMVLARARRFESPVIVDVGTGSGAIALTLAKHLPSAQIIAIDISIDALTVAQINSARLGLQERVRFLQGDLLEPLDRSFDILVANLPYISSRRFAQLPREVREFEPRLALDGGDDGLAIVRRLLSQLEPRAARSASAFFEISEEQGAAAIDLFKRQFPRATVELHKDLEGLDRVIEMDLPDLGDLEGRR